MAGAPAFLSSPLYSDPVLEVVRQPQKRGYRFRYHSEGLTHGGIRGEPKAGEKEGRIYPTIKLNGHRGPAKVVVTIVTANDNPNVPAQLHAHSLIVDKKKTEGHHVFNIDGRDPVLELTTVAIQHVVKDNIVDTLVDRVLQSRFLEKYGWSNSVNHPDAKHFANLTAFTNALKNSENGRFTNRETNEKVVGEELAGLRSKAEEWQKSMAMNKCRLSFQVFLKGEDGHFSKKLDPVYSDIIFDGKTKHGAALKIMRMSKVTSSVNGDEEVWLIADKLHADDLEVRFYEDAKPGQPNGWEAFGKFQKTDVLKMICLIFRTPEYHDKQISQPVKIKLQLRRKSDPDCISDPHSFTYTPVIDRYGIGEKRRKELPMDEILGFTQSLAKRPCIPNMVANNAFNLPNVLLQNLMSQQFMGQQMMSQQMNAMNYNPAAVTSSLNMNTGTASQTINYGTTTSNQTVNYGKSTYHNLTNSSTVTSNAMNINNLSFSNSRPVVSSAVSEQKFADVKSFGTNNSISSSNTAGIPANSTVKIERVEADLKTGATNIQVMDTSATVNISQAVESEDNSNTLAMFTNQSGGPSESLLKFINAINSDSISEFN